MGSRSSIEPEPSYLEEVQKDNRRLKELAANKKVAAPVKEGIAAF